MNKARNFQFIVSRLRHLPGLHDCLSITVTELPADDGGVDIIPTVIADGTPLVGSLEKNLHSSRTVGTAPRQTQASDS